MSFVREPDTGSTAMRIDAALSVVIRLRAMIRRALTQLFVRYDIRPMLVRFPTARESRFINETYYAQRPQAMRVKEWALADMYLSSVDGLIARGHWGALARMLGTMYDHPYYPKAETILNRLALQERTTPVPHAVIAKAYAVPARCLFEFTDTCTSIDELARLMNALVRNERWDVMSDFLSKAMILHKNDPWSDGGCSMGRAYALR